THPVIRAALIDTDERIEDVLVHDGFELAGRTLKELRLRTATGADVIALQRQGRWINKPRATRRLEVGDRLVVLAPEEGVQRLRSWAGDPRPVEDPDEGANG